MSATRLLRMPFGLARQAIVELDRFVRLHFLGATFMMTVLGAASVSPRLELDVLAGLLLVAICYHNYAYVLNDVVDLPVDRLSPSRARDPLVRGTVRPRQALAFALLQVPVALLVTLWLRGGLLAYISLLGGLALMTVYNLWGKRAALPPLTDLAQGVAWGALTIYAAAIVGSPNRLSLVAAAYVAGFILLINGIHGGLRDLESDLAGDKRTTAIFFGARPRPDGTTAVPLGVHLFSYSVQIGLIVLIMGAVLSNQFEYGPQVWRLALALTVMLAAVNLVHMNRVLEPDLPRWDYWFRFHLLLLLQTLIVPWLPHLGIPLAILVESCLLLPLLLLETSGDLFQGIRRRLRAR